MPYLHIKVSGIVPDADAAHGLQAAIDGGRMRAQGRGGAARTAVGGERGDELEVGMVQHVSYSCEL